MTSSSQKHPMMARDGGSFPVLAVVVLLAGGLLAGLSGLASARTLQTVTGLTVNVHTADEIAANWIVEDGGRTLLRHPVAGEVELDTDLYPWSDLVPVDEDVILDAVAGMEGFRTDLAIEIFLLPGFPAEALSSFARRESVFMAPGFGVQAPETVAYVAVHEIGHVFCWATMDGREDRWADYRRLRGLTVQDDPASLMHADRNREIIAEDFRFLFGGALATSSGSIENASLPLPGAVDGLRELLAGYLASPAGGLAALQPSRVYPNPCRAHAVVELALADDADKTLSGATVLEVFDVRGRLVRRLDSERVAGGRATVTWDGNGADGRRAPAGIYLYRIARGASTGQGRILLLDR